MKKKIVSLLLTLCLAVPFVATLTGCKNDEAKVMNLSLNPSVEFVLDGNDKVVSVNALNDEGNFVIASATFVGLSAEDAAELFVQVTEENGFIVKGSAGENELSIEISGETAEKLYNKVKKSATDYIATLQNVEVSVTFDQTTVEDLQALVKQCMQELPTATVEGLSEEELIKKIEESRKETENLLSQELKDLYYQTRAVELLNAKLEKVKELVNQSSAFVGTFVSQLTTGAQTMLSKLAEFKTKFVETYLDPNSEYQQKMAEYISAKKALLEERLAGASESVIALKEQAVALKESALETAKQLANLAVTAIDGAINTAITTINSAIDSILGLVTIDINTVEDTVNGKKTTIKATFNNEYSAYIEINYWKDLEPNASAA